MKKKLVLAMAILVIAGMITACGQKKEVEPVTEKVQEEITEEQTEETEEALEETEEDVESENEETESENENFYSVCTDFSKTEVENFVAEVLEEFKKQDWETIASKIYYPITINETYYANEEEFLSTDWSHNLEGDFMDELNAAEPKEMFCNWTGINAGPIWFNQVEDTLKITSMNYWDEATQLNPEEGIIGSYEMDLEKTNENLKNYSDIMELLGSGFRAGSDFSILEDGTFSYSLAIAEYFTGTYKEEGDTVYLYSDDLEKVPEVKKRTIDGINYLISDYDAEDIYWKKLASPNVE